MSNSSVSVPVSSGSFHWKGFVVKTVKSLFPDDVKIRTSDGEVWANKSFLCASNDYFSAMLDQNKFLEGKAGVGNMSEYSSRVVNIVINFFYTGEICCKASYHGNHHFSLNIRIQDLSLKSLLHLQDFLRKILLFDQSTKIQEYTKSRFAQFTKPECLLGFVRAQDLNLEIAEDLFNFIMDNLGATSIIESPTSESAQLLDPDQSKSLGKRFKIVQKYLEENVDEETSDRIIASLDFSVFTKEELLFLVRKHSDQLNQPNIAVGIYKDRISVLRNSAYWLDAFIPQHVSKLKERKHESEPLY